MNRTYLDVKNVTVNRAERILLHQVNWRTMENEHWALLGANGAGKTTLLQTILGYLWPTSGQISVLGHQLGQYDVRELRKRIGFVSSNMDMRLDPDALAWELVAAGSLATYALYTAVDQAEKERAIERLVAIGAQEITHQSYAYLSQGERQKVLIARAMQSNPDLLILDEPCNGLDFPSRENLLDVIQQIGEHPGGPQLIYVTHYPDEIVPAITHALVLHEGCVMSQGIKRSVINETVLSEAFHVPVRVNWQDDFPIVRVRRDR